MDSIVYSFWRGRRRTRRRRRRRRRKKRRKIRRRRKRSTDSGLHCQGDGEMESCLGIRGSGYIVEREILRAEQWR